MKRKDLINISLLIIVISLAFLRLNFRKETQKQSKIIMDTLVEIKITGPHISAKNYIDSTFTLMQELEKKFDYFDSTSYLSSINNQSNFALDKDFVELLSYTKKLHADSDGLYDISIGNLVDQWDFTKKTIPTTAQIKKAKKEIGFNKIKIDKNKILKPKKLKIVLGSIAKGFIIDKAVKYLESKKNIKYGVVAAGGDLRTFGYKKKIVIGVQHPRKRDQLIAKLSIKNNAIVTSGDYERFFIHNNKRYHHIINPKTGYPSENTFSVTIISENAMKADALSTACFVMKPENAIQMINKTKNTEAMIYFKNDKEEIISIKTKGMKGYLKDEY